ncbi:TolC family protein [Novosphingobium panipatense]
MSAPGSARLLPGPHKSAPPKRVPFPVSSSPAFWGLVERNRAMCSTPESGGAADAAAQFSCYRLRPQPGAVQEAEAQRDAAEGQYRKAVLSALQDAEDSLARFGATRQQLAQLIQAERSAAGAARLNRQRFEAGTSTLIDQLDIERQQLSSSIAVAQAKAQLTIDYIAIQKALGLGWSEPAEPATR